MPMTKHTTIAFGLAITASIMAVTGAEAASSAAPRACDRGCTLDPDHPQRFTLRDGQGRPVATATRRTGQLSGWVTWELRDSQGKRIGRIEPAPSERRFVK